MPRYSIILPELLVGAYPRDGDEILALNRDAGVNAILNLQTDSDLTRLGIDWSGLLDACGAHGVLIERIPITDYDAADLRRQLAAGAGRVHRMIKSGHRVYLHCTLGLERSPSLAIAYLAWYRGWPLDQAWEHVRQQRQCTPNFEAVWLAHRARNTRDGSA
jgi:hypothetical protein